MGYFKFLAGKKAAQNSQISRLYLKMRSRFTILFFVLIIVPVVVLAVSMHLHSKAAVEKNIRQMSILDINQEKNSLYAAVNDLKAAMDAVASDASIESLVTGIASLPAEDSRKMLGERVGSHLAPGRSMRLKGAYVLKEGKIVLTFNNGVDKAVISDPSNQSWYREALSNPPEPVVPGATQRFYGQGRSSMVFSMVQRLKASPDQSPSILLLDFDYGVLSDLIPKTEKGNEIRIITDESGNVIYSTESGSLTAALDPLLADLVGTEADGFRQVNYRGVGRYLTYVRFSEPSWTFMLLLPVSETTGVLNPAASPVMLPLIVLVTLILLFFLAASFRILRPINELTSAISGYGDLQASAAGNRLKSLSEIDHLIKEVYDIRLKQKEAELNSLQNQINPHFLYNTLESIRGAALHNGLHDIADMSKALSLLFRYSISDTALVSIKEELQHLENYMSIQNFRYENKFDLVYSIPPELYGYKILKLTLQPLIENSIKHGLEMRLGKGVIKIDIICIDGNIKINISDNGIGIPSRKVEELNRALAKDEFDSGKDATERTGTGIGVRNVNSRIKLYFGTQYGLKFRDVMVGTTVEITLPVVKEQE